MNAAEVFIRALEEEGVSVVFGYPGAAICPVYDALSRSSIRHVLVRSEQNAGHAASGYSRSGNKIGVCLTTSGPGATNLMTALATAYMDSIPLIAVTGQVSSELLGRDVFQEADITGASSSFTKHSYLVKEPEELPQILHDAIHIASTGRPGPVLIDLPIDVQQAETEYHPARPVNIRGYKPTTKGHPIQVKRLADALSESRRPVLCAGGGVFASHHAVQAFRETAQRFQIPVVHTMMGKGVMPYDHPLSLGMIGTHGAAAANRATMESDLLILVGARVGDRAVMTPNVLAQHTRIVHIDIDPAEIGKNMSTYIPIVGDAGNVLRQLLDKEISVDSEAWLLRIESFKGPEPSLPCPEGTVSPKAFLSRLTDSLTDTCIYTADVGQHQIWSARWNKVKRGKFLTSCGMGTMGYALPAAIGAALAKPVAQVVAVCGDGSFQMQLPELATVVQEKLPLRIIVMKNQRLGMIGEIQDRQYNGNHFAIQLGDLPDLEKIAQAYGLGFVRVSCPEEMGGIDRLLRAKGPCLLECLVSEEFCSAPA